MRDAAGMGMWEVEGCGVVRGVMSEGCSRYGNVGGGGV